jgi:hypothetical protein
MPIELTAAQAAKIAELASDLGGQLSLHQLADGRDVYISPAGKTDQYVISVDGDASEVTGERGAAA